MGEEMRRVGTVLLVLVLLAGCVTTTVRPIEATKYPIALVCIQENPRSEVDLLGILEDGFQRHGINTRVVSAPSMDCRYVLTYTATTGWDLTTYLKRAELRLKDGDHMIGSAAYKHAGGFDLSKFASAKSKLDPVLDELLSGFPPRRE